MDAGSQALLYIWSAFLPMIMFLGISHWKGLKYIRSGEAKVRTIGWVALTIMVVSTVVIIWGAVVYTERAVQDAVDSVTADFGIGD